MRSDSAPWWWGREVEEELKWGRGWQTVDGLAVVSLQTEAFSQCRLEAILWEGNMTPSKHPPPFPGGSTDGVLFPFPPGANVGRGLFPLPVCCEPPLPSVTARAVGQTFCWFSLWSCSFCSSCQHVFIVGAA